MALQQMSNKKRVPTRDKTKQKLLIRHKTETQNKAETRQGKARKSERKA